SSTRSRLFVCFHFLPRSFVSSSADTQAYLLLFRAHFDDFEFVLNAWLQVNLLSIRIHCLGIVAQTFNAFSDFYEGSESGDPQHLAVNNVANPVLVEERFPNVRLQLLHPERKAALF